MNLVESISPIQSLKLGGDIKRELTADYVKADSLMLKLVFIHLAVALGITPFAFGSFQTSFTIAAVFGGLATILSVVAYKFYKGTIYARLILGSALLIFTLIFIQQSLGKIECHFHLWIVLGILIRYKDSMPIFFTTALIVVHHASLNYCQQYNLELFGEPIRVFEFTSGWGIVLLHAAFVAPSAVIYAILVRDNTQQFIEQVRLLKELDEKKGEMLAQNEELRQQSEELNSINENLEGALQDVHVAQQEAKKLAVVAEHTQNAVIITDAIGKIEYVNEAFEEMTGYHKEEVGGQKPGDFLQGPNTDTATKKYISEKLGEQKPFSAEIINYTKEGREYWINLDISPVFDGDELVNFVGIQADITEIKLQKDKLQKDKNQAEQAFTQLKHNQSSLIQTEKMSLLGQLTAGIAHEINNPINFVYAGTNTLRLLVSDMMKVLDQYDVLAKQVVAGEDHLAQMEEIEALKKEIEYVDLKEDINGMLEDITKGTERTEEIVKSLRTFSRIGEDGFRKADLHDNIDSTLVILNTKFKDRISVEKHYAEFLPDVACNIGEINQVFVNLISNAIDAIDGKGVIHIKTWADQSHAYISIADSGAGIPEERLSKIFEPFFTTKDIGKGTGLGLAISHGIIENHQGTIEVKSEMGKGTVFVIQLPIDQPEGEMLS